MAVKIAKRIIHQLSFTPLGAIIPLTNSMIPAKRKSIPRLKRCERSAPRANNITTNRVLTIMATLV